MTVLPWFHPKPRESQVQLDVVPRGVIDALARGEAHSIAAQYVSLYLMGPDCLSLWRLRSAQIAADPLDIPWVTRLIRDPEITMPVGVAGFHGAPDHAGMVEIGYRVDPAWRRRGYAKRSIEILLAVAQNHPDVQTIRASVSPDNSPSIALVTTYGFTPVGEQWDEEDGLETIYELPASAESATRPKAGRSGS